MTASRKIRTLHVLPELKEGGLERGVVDKAIWLREHGIDADVVSAGGIWLDRLERAGVTHHTLPVNYKNPASILYCSSKLRRIIRDEDINLVSAHSRAPAWAAHLATWHGRTHNPPLITVAQGYYEANPYSRVMCRGDRIIAVSSSIRDHMVEKLGADPDRIHVIPRGCSSDEFKADPKRDPAMLRSKWGVPPNAILIAGIGRLSRTKGWEDLIDAVGMMKEENVHCVLAGSLNRQRGRYFRLLEEKTESLGIGDRVRFIGHQEDMCGVYKAADIIAAPSRLPEPFGRVIIESLMSGCPVITTEGCGAAEYLGDDFRRFVVSVRSPALITERIREIISNREEVDRTIARLEKRIRNELTLDRQMESTLEVYEECTGCR